MNKQSIKALCRFENKRMLGEHKADARIGGLFANFPDDTKSSCFKCKRDIYFCDTFDDIDDMVKKKHKNFCPYCAILMKGVTKEQKVILKDIIRIYEIKRRV
jgi:hypothetical protein